jgi:hypothetical protein
MRGELVSEPYKRAEAATQDGAVANSNGQHEDEEEEKKVALTADEEEEEKQGFES